MDDTHRFRLPNDLAKVPLLRDQFVQACVAAGLSEDERAVWMLVFTELVNNSIEHGCSCPEDYVEGLYRIGSDEVEVEVTDPGETLTAESFDASQAEDFSETGRGAGLYLIREFSDSVDVRPAPGGGTTIRVLRRRSQEGRA